MKAYRYRIYPNKTTAAIIDETIETCRRHYNSCLAERIEAWVTRGESFTIADQQKSLPQKRNDSVFLQRVFCQVLHDVQRRLDRSYSSFFRRIKAGVEKPGFPRFKGRVYYNSFTYTQAGFNLAGSRLNLSMIGEVDINLHRPMEGKIKTLTVTRKNGAYYACFSCEVEKEKADLTGKFVGIDLGVRNFVVTSDDEKFPGLHAHHQAEKHLRKLQSQRDRKQKGSARRRELNRVIGKTHEEIANIRKDYSHKIARHLIEKYDTIFYEKLDIKYLTTQDNKYLRKHNMDAAWGTFVNILKQKAESVEGKKAIGVDPKNTTQLCSNCGEVVPKTLADRVHRCQYCGIEMDRDLNAAINVLNKGLLILSMCDSAKTAGDRQI